MAPIPEWAPNLHPLLVHFPITLLLTASAFDLIGLIRSTQSRTGPFLYAPGTWPPAPHI